jgi:hypothetical protein
MSRYPLDYSSTSFLHRLKVPSSSSHASPFCADREVSDSAFLNLWRVASASTDAVDMEYLFS